MDNSVGAIRARIERVTTVFARNCKYRRIALGMSQEAVIDKLKVYGIEWHQSTLAKFEGGKRGLQLKEASALAEVYRTSLGALYEGVDLDRIGSMKFVGTGPNGSRFVESMKKLPARDLAKASQIAGEPEAP